jgi:hypothetical protein
VVLSRQLRVVPVRDDCFQLHGSLRHAGANLLRVRPEPRAIRLLLDRLQLHLISSPIVTTGT